MGHYRRQTTVAHFMYSKLPANAAIVLITEANTAHNRSTGQHGPTQVKFGTDSLHLPLPSHLGRIPGLQLQSTYGSGCSTMSHFCQSSLGPQFGPSTAGYALFWCRGIKGPPYPGRLLVEGMWLQLAEVEATQRSQRAETEGPQRYVPGLHCHAWRFKGMYPPQQSTALHSVPQASPQHDRVRPEMGFGQKGMLMDQGAQPGQYAAVL